MFQDENLPLPSMGNVSSGSSSSISDKVPGLMRVYIRQTSNTTSNRNTLVDFVKVVGDREV